MKTPIRTTKQVKLTEIQEHPRNPNHGDAGAIIESLDEHDQFRAIGVSEATGNVVYGNHTYLAAGMKGESTILAHLMPNLTPDQEMAIMLADNSYARKATTDDYTLASILTDLNMRPGGLRGTGYDLDDLGTLSADLEAPLSFDDPPDDPSVLEHSCPKCGFRFNPGVA